jgi:hypothetical protein
MLRQNLNTFARNGVFEVRGSRQSWLRGCAIPKAVRRAKVFPYQLMVAFTAAEAGMPVPELVRDALQDAMEIALANVPEVAGRVVVCPDVSGSMASPVTGYRKGSTSARCAVSTSLPWWRPAFLRRNPTARVLPFEHDVVDIRLNARDSGDDQCREACRDRRRRDELFRSAGAAGRRRRRRSTLWCSSRTTSPGWMPPRMCTRAPRRCRTGNRLKLTNPQAKLVASTSSPTPRRRRKAVATSSMSAASPIRSSR